MNISLEDERSQYCYPEANGSCVKGTYTTGSKPVLYMFFSIGMGITVTGNLVVIISIAHFKQLHTPTNMLLMSMALADLLVGVFVMPFSMIRAVEGCWYFGNTFCFVHSTFDMFLTAVSVFHHVSVAVDRYQAVCNPLRYPTIMTIPVAWLMVALSWGVPGVYSYGLLYSKTNTKGLEKYIALTDCLGYCNIVFNEFWASLDTAFTFFLPCFVMIVLYAKIFLVARQHVRQLESMNRPTNLKSENNNMKPPRSERKAAKALGLVVSVFILCWMPLHVVTVIDPFTNFTTPEIIIETFQWLGYFNSTVNPIIYAFFYPWFQKSLKLIVTLKIFIGHSTSTNIFVSKDNCV